MVYQMPCPGKSRIFVASSFSNEDQAHQELTGWASGNGYQFAGPDRTFTVYGCEQRPRQWVLMERAGQLASQTN
ncbi:MAG: hypothetical protein ACRYFS_01380 [Janthinobacterium lividum]